MLLPPELIDHIFSFLRGDISALKACSEAHPSVSRLAERHLYADIWTFPHEDSDLLGQLSENPRLLEHPRALTIYGGLEGQILPTMGMIPRMPNLRLVSLAIFRRDPCPSYQFKEFISMLTTCLLQSSIEQLLPLRIP
jgi:hypothetical protein